MHIDRALEYNQDPSYLAELLIHKLTVEARRRLGGSGLSRRELARRLNTSVPQSTNPDPVGPRTRREAP